MVTTPAGVPDGIEQRPHLVRASDHPPVNSLRYLRRAPLHLIDGVRRQQPALDRHIAGWTGTPAADLDARLAAIAS